MIKALWLAKKIAIFEREILKDIWVGIVLKYFSKGKKICIYIHTHTHTWANRVNVAKS